MLNKITPYTRIVHLSLLHLIVIAGLFYFPLSYYVYSFIFYFLFGAIGISLTHHRHYSHRCFKKFPKWLECVGLTLGTLAGQGSAIEWAMTHRKHHKKSDTVEDPHSPLFKNTFLLYWDILRRQNNVSLLYGKDFFNDKLMVAFHNAYWYIHAAYISVLLVLGIKYFMICYAIPIVCIWFATGYGIAILSHKKGYVNYPTNDNSKNNLLVGWLMFGEGYQNNHHKYPTDPMLSKRWYEYDFLGALSKKIFC